MIKILIQIANNAGFCPYVSDALQKTYIDPKWIFRSHRFSVNLNSVITSENWWNLFYCLLQRFICQNLEEYKPGDPEYAASQIALSLPEILSFAAVTQPTDRIGTESGASTRFVNSFGGYQAGGIVDESFA